MLGKVVFFASLMILGTFYGLVIYQGLQKIRRKLPHHPRLKKLFDR